jgi:hypothetical protein
MIEDMKLTLKRRLKIFQLSKNLVLRIVSSRDFQVQWPTTKGLRQDAPNLGYIMGLPIIVCEPWDAGDALEPSNQSTDTRKTRRISQSQLETRHIVILTIRDGDLTRAVWADEIYFPEEELLQAKI